MMKSSEYREGGYDGRLLDSLGLVLDFRRSRNRDKSAGSFPEERLEIESKGAYHLSELTDPGELVLISPNGKQRANLRDFAHEPCVGYAQ